MTAVLAGVPFGLLEGLVDLLELEAVRDHLPERDRVLAAGEEVEQLGDDVGGVGDRADDVLAGEHQCRGVEGDGVAGEVEADLDERSPPFRSIATPSVSSSGRPTSSITASAPRPPVRSLTRCTRVSGVLNSSMLMVWSAPNSSPSWRRFSRRSRTMTL